MVLTAAAKKELSIELASLSSGTSGGDGGGDDDDDDDYGSGGSGRGGARGGSRSDYPALSSQVPPSASAKRRLADSQRAVSNNRGVKSAREGAD